jgi:hypothetical protein
MKTIECPNCRYKGEESYFEYADETRHAVSCGRCLCEFKVSSREIVDPGCEVRFRNCDACGETLVEGSNAYGVVFGEMDYPDYGSFVADDLAPWDRVFHQECWEELMVFSLHNPGNPFKKS